jgi:large subunit ribosomal protein L35
MPKMKTDRGVAKRFRVTGSGRILRQRAFRRHYLEHKPSTRTRRLKGLVDVSKGDAKKVRRQLGI